MSLFPPAPEPKTALGRYKVLSPSAGLKVSPLSLGAMNFGDAWKGFMGECNKDTTFEILDFFYEHGGNWIDTANNYQSEESETWIGEWMEKRGVRDQMVIATKFTNGFKVAKRSEVPLQANYVGNGSKSLRVSLDASLKKLKTDYVDILYVHWWDTTTSIEELMISLNRMVTAGKVLYLGVSDAPAWVVSKANQYARDHGLRPFSVYQGLWSASNRDMERDIIPMCLAEGMAIAPWGALGGGKYKTKEQRESGEGRKLGGPSDADLKVSEVLEKIAKNRGTIMTSIALAYTVNTAPDVYPIVGGRKVEHLKGNIEALNIKLTQEEMDEIRQAYGWNAGFPHSFLYGPQVYKPNEMNVSHISLAKASAHYDIPTPRQPAFPPGAK